MTTRERVAGVILAGGLARRMGGHDKGLMRLGGTPFLNRVVTRLGSQVDVLAINANGDASRYSEFRLPIVADSIPDAAGPLAGVLAGMEWAAGQECAWVATAATDTPFFPTDLVDRLRAAVGESGARLGVASSGGRPHPVFGLWAVDLRDDLRGALVSEGIRKVDQWTARHGPAVVDFAAIPYDPFFNANRPEDLATAEHMLHEHQL
ncbi:MAG TPA: molybdenum cofactor guanylyltransferase MobA [Aestuariivirgaceae bacterium]|nr:molybdenum cofactor guanylyltransferase MobA [Aestuariivirgaceae bacterium]